MATVYDLALLKTVVARLVGAGVRVWVFGGWG